MLDNNSFYELIKSKNFTVSELDKLPNDIEKLENLMHENEELKNLKNEKQAMISKTRIMADDSMLRKPEYTEKMEKLERLRDELSEKIAQYKSFLTYNSSAIIELKI